jgi:hypothetical protein
MDPLQKGKKMANILQLQRLTPTLDTADFNINLASSVSSACPDDIRLWELD